MKKLGIAVLAAIMALGLPGALPAATREWSGGGGGDDNWSTSANWLDGVPPVSGTDSALFNDADLGDVNVVDQEWTLVGLSYSNSSASLWHTTDLANHTLGISGGGLRVGYNATNCLVVITNGTLNLSLANKADVTVGYNGAPTVYVEPLYRRTNNVLTVFGTVNATNMGTIRVGVSAYGAEGYGFGGGTWDLRGATLVENRLKAANVYVGAGSGDGYPFPSGGLGLLKLPPTVTDIESGGDFVVGVGQWTFGGIGYVDIGSNSALQRLTVGNKFYLGYGGDGNGASPYALVGRIGYQSADSFVDYMPTGLVLTIGQAGAPGALVVGFNADYAYTNAIILSNGTFSGYLSTLAVGMNVTDPGRGSGLLDLSDATVQIGDEPNKIKVGSLMIGAGGPASWGPRGTLRLPTNITEIVVGDFILGRGGWTYGGEGTLDIGSNSALRRIAATNSFALGDYAATIARVGYSTANGFVTGFPKGLVLELGSADHTIPVRVGHCMRYGNTEAKQTVLALTNGTFSGFMSELEVGVNETDLVAYPEEGHLDLRGATVNAFVVNGAMMVGAWTNYAPGIWPVNNWHGYGYVHLPAGNASAFGLFVGGPTNSYPANPEYWAFGLVELYGTHFTVGEKLLIDNTGVISNHVSGVAGGVDFASSETNNFVINPGGKLNLSFDADPVDTTRPYWGLKMQGNAVSYLESLTSSPARLTWNIDGLGEKYRMRFGIHYEDREGYTYVGVAPGSKGALMWVQ